MDVDMAGVGGVDRAIGDEEAVEEGAVDKAEMGSEHVQPETDRCLARDFVTSGRFRQETDCDRA